MNLSRVFVAPVQFFRRFVRNERGVALIEFAFAFPILFLLIFGGIEVVRLMLIHQKLEKSGYVLGDVITQYLPAQTDPAGSNEISVVEMTDNVFPLFTRTMDSYGAAADQMVIVTSLQRVTPDTKIRWQIAGGGTLADAAVVSVTNGLAPGAIDAGVKDTIALFATAPTEKASIDAMADAANVVVVEVFYMYRPILQTVLQGVGGASGFNFFLSNQVYSKRMYFSPRNGVMRKLPPTFF